MAQYNPKSLHAEEFINHEEILETLKYAEENKHNIELIDSILEKAPSDKDRHRRTLCRSDASRSLRAAGLRHSRKRSRRCISWPRRSSWRSTATASLCLRRSICPITASTAAFTVRITRKTAISPAKS